MVATYANVSETGRVIERSGALYGVLLTAGPTPATLVLHDNAASADGSILAVIKAPANESLPWSQSVPYLFSEGIHATITGSSAMATVVYIEG